MEPYKPTEALKKEGIEDIKAKLQEYEEQRPRKDPFQLKHGNLSGFKLKLSNIRQNFKALLVKAKKKRPLKYYDVIYLSNKENTIYLVGGFADEFSLGFRARREIIRPIDVSKLLPCETAAGLVEVAFYDDHHLANIDLPQFSSENEGDIQAVIKSMENDWVRTVQDDSHKTLMTPDRSFMNLLLLTAIICLVGGVGMGVLGTIWIISTGLI